MSSNTPGARPAPPALNRRQLLGLAAGTAATLVVSQSVLGCSASSATEAGSSDTTSGSDSTSSAGNVSCVLTAALTEGPFFVDEKLERSDIRTDPVTGAVSPDTVHALSPYSKKGRRDTVNTTDGIYASLSSAERSALTLRASPSGDGYSGLIALAVRIG
jgi:hypothetical protein